MQGQPKLSIEFQKIVYLKLCDVQRHLIHEKINVLTNFMVQTTNVQFVRPYHTADIPAVVYFRLYIQYPVSVNEHQRSSNGLLDVLHKLGFLIW